MKIEEIEALVVNWGSRKEPGRYYGILELFSLMKPLLVEVLNEDDISSVGCVYALQEKLSKVPEGQEYPHKVREARFE